jgi:pSer/pThr/pTyr-binding forkhead associated (FHA) protein
MVAKLLLREAGSSKDVTVELTLAGVVIGRGHDCAVHTDDPLVSRRNTKVGFNGGRWFVEDLGSSNGTFVNGERVQSRPLAPDDLIRCGSLQVRFVEAAAEAEVIERPVPAMTLVSEALAEAKAELETDNARLRRRIEELERAETCRRDEVQALTAIGTELGAEVAELKSGRGGLEQRASELEEELRARDRQLERAHEDVAQHKQQADELRAQLAEVKETASSSWRQLKESTGEMDKLKRVMGQQERLLDERRMGLTALETAIQTLRAERDKLMQAQISLAHERDELRRQLGLSIGHGPTMEMARTTG